ncbi:MAG: RNA polymerase sigma factor [Woeseiaceae bacterium]
MLNAEQALIARAKSGDQAAFTMLATQYRDRLLQFLWIRCGHQHDAEDATQNALINAWTYLSSYRSDWQFSTWLYRIGLRELGKRPVIDTGYATEPTAPDRTELALDIENVWRKAQQVLSADACTALWLRYAEDASIGDIAEVTGKSQVSIKVGLMRSRNRLAKELRDETNP